LQLSGRGIGIGLLGSWQWEYQVGVMEHCGLSVNNRSSPIGFLRSRARLEISTQRSRFTIKKYFFSFFRFPTSIGTPLFFSTLENKSNYFTDFVSPSLFVQSVIFVVCTDARIAFVTCMLQQCNYMTIIAMFAHIPFCAQYIKKEQPEHLVLVHYCLLGNYLQDQTKR
jgi:hypothetical protein